MSHSSPIIQDLERELIRTDIPEFRAGDRIAVHALISEGGKDRIQVFEGVCIHRRNSGLRGALRSARSPTTSASSGCGR